MTGSTSTTLRGAVLRFHGDPQPPRGKLTRAKLRTLRILGAHYPEPVPVTLRRGVQRRTMRSLERFGVVRRVDHDRYTLTLVGLTAVARYTPRPRGGL